MKKKFEGINKFLFYMTINSFMLMLNEEVNRDIWIIKNEIKIKKYKINKICYIILKCIDEII